MPYEFVRMKSGKYRVRNRDTGKYYSKHGQSREIALKQLAALHANTHEDFSKDDDEDRCGHKCMVEKVIKYFWNIDKSLKYNKSDKSMVLMISEMFDISIGYAKLILSDAIKRVELKRTGKKESPEERLERRTNLLAQAAEK